jgi:pyruvate dehydrogenase E1 component
MTAVHRIGAATPSAPKADTALDVIASRVLWLSTAMIHHANRLRPNPSGLKVGGHQASCASIVSRS